MRTLLIFLACFFSYQNLLSQQQCDSLDAWDSPLWQLQTLDIDDLHANGFTGKGVRIAVFDNGFLNVDQLPGFEHLDVLFTRDLVEQDDDVYGPCEGTCTHGQRVLSVMASRGPDDLTGAAPDAQYLLFRTEDDRNEAKFEEGYWKEAARLADSLGADIIISSLVYLTFDDGSGYDKDQLNGRVAITSQAAIAAARKGILVVNSAGNAGRGGLLAPADADSILSVGAVYQDERLAPFSSRGPTADGRIKPEVVAQGVGVFLVNPQGELSKSNGTSYSAPLVAGLAACLWQAMEEHGLQPDAQAIRSAIMASADRASNPDNNFGYGIPKGAKAYKSLIREELNVKALCPKNFAQTTSFIYPNPSQNQAFYAFRMRGDAQVASIQIMDKTGRLITSEQIHIAPDQLYSYPLPSSIKPGHYAVRLVDEQGIRIGGALWMKM
ncbi:MAG: S8 family serine peptidase [Bacteroidia bacterium]